MKVQEFMSACDNENNFMISIYEINENTNKCTNFNEITITTFPNEWLNAEVESWSFEDNLLILCVIKK